jgi:hypothetical protein
MNGAHFHLVLNHVPIIGTVFGMLVLLTGIILKINYVKMTGLGALVISSLSMTIVLFSGDPAKEDIMGLPGISEAMIEHHETIAYSSLWAVIPMGLLAALAFYSLYKEERSGNVLARITLFLAIIALGILSWVGLSGGEIRHTEIRDGYVAPSNPGNVESDED